MFAFLLPLQKSDFTSLKLVKGGATKEEKLVAALKANHPQALRTLYKMYAPALFGIIKRIVKFEEIAEDVLQDTFVKIWKSINNYDPSKGKLFTWMANLAKNSAIDQLRSKAAVNATKTEDIQDMPIDIIDSKTYFQFNTDAIGLKELLVTLKADQRTIIDMIYFQGYTHVQTSEILNIPLGTIKTKIRLSILVLRKYFQEAGISLKDHN